jgi:hypothetical protein
VLVVLVIVVVDCPSHHAAASSPAPFALVVGKVEAAARARRDAVVAAPASTIDALSKRLNAARHILQPALTAAASMITTSRCRLRRIDAVPLILFLLLQLELGELLGLARGLAGAVGGRGRAEATDDAVLVVLVFVFFLVPVVVLVCAAPRPHSNRQRAAGRRRGR